MNPVARAVFLVALTAVGGCAGLREFMEGAAAAQDRDRWRAAAERERYLKTAPGLTSPVRYAIERGQVIEGMREADVEASLGPAAVSTARRRGAHRVVVEGFRERPGIPPSIFVTFEDGVVVGESHPKK